MKAELNKMTVKVLLVEDDEDDYILTSGLISEIKGTEYSVDWVASYAEALRVVTHNEHDVCLVDYRLGSGTGLQLLLAAAAIGCRTPIILLTGQGDKELDLEATEAGAADYLIKGQIEASVLERSMRYAIKHAHTLESLRESESRFRSVVESASDAIVLADGGGAIISWNKGAETIFGYTTAEVTGQPLAALLAETSRTSKNQDMQQLLASGAVRLSGGPIELLGLKQDGTQFPLELSLSSWQTAQGAFYSGIIRDVTERKALEEQLSHQALHDPLTHLANRVLFRNRVEHALMRADRHHESFGVLFLDLDNFKTINDSLGHDAGDRLLTAVAERLQASLRITDTAARLGGDEFAILVEDASHTDDAVLVAERLTDVLRTPFLLEDKQVFINASVGIAVATNGQESADALLRNADVAMYMAKNQGKNRYVVFEGKMHTAMLNRMELESDLRQAIDRNEFVIHYQPIVTLQSGHITGVEALVRWNHPKRGLLQPADFISIAEETGLIVPLGTWVLEQACQKMRDWQLQYPEKPLLSVTVNLSNRQLQQVELPAVVSAALIKSGLEPRCLVLEITEGVMMENTKETICRLQELKKLGIMLAIDDFGTGYSSLSYLAQFPMDVLKIDKSFVDKIISGSEGTALMRAIITMSQTLHLSTVAEGIEEPEQLEALQSMGCKLGQGFHFAKPLSEQDMGSFLNKASTDLNWAEAETPASDLLEVALKSSLTSRNEQAGLNFEL